MENTVLPIGCFGEEGSEARNKMYKHDRQFHARKTSRQSNLADIFNRAMDTSDPIISSINLAKGIRRQHKLTIPSEVLSMLAKPTLEEGSQERSDDEEKEAEEKDDKEEEEEKEEEPDYEDSEDVLEEILPTHLLDALELENDF